MIPEPAVRHGLRVPLALAGRAPTDEPPRVRRVDPPSGALGVFRDAPVVLTLSAPLDPASLDATTVRVEDGSQPVGGFLFASPDGTVVIWCPERPLAPGVPHVVRVDGLRDRHGREVALHRSWFVCGELLGSDLQN